jgi:TatA/E family protein of Tat protein translocase
MIGDILQPTHLLFILVVALLVLGPKRLPEASRAIGQGIRDFKMAISGEDRDHGAMSTPQMSTGVTPPYAPVATAAPPPTEATAPVFAADPAPTAADPAPTASEPTPTASEPTPTASEPTPTASEPTPTASEPTPAASHEAETTAPEPAAEAEATSQPTEPAQPVV